MLSIRYSWSICHAKESRIPCQTGVFAVDIQFTQKELSDYLNDLFWIELLKAFNAGSTYIYYLRRCTWKTQKAFFSQARIPPFLYPTNYICNIL